MCSVFVITLLSLVAQAHPNDSIDKLGDKLAFTLSKSVEKLGDTMAHSVDKLGDTLADNLSNKLADRVLMMQSRTPGDLENTVHAKPGLGPRAGHAGFPSPSLKAPSLSDRLRPPFAAAKPLEPGPKATVGRVNIQNLYNPVHTAAEAKALSAAGFGHHVRRPAPATREHKEKWPLPMQEFETGEHGGAYGLLSREEPRRPFKFSSEAIEFVPKAFKHVPETTSRHPRHPFKFSPHAAEFVPTGFESPSEMRPPDAKRAILGNPVIAPMMLPKRPPAFDIDSVIDRDISSSFRRKAPGMHVKSEFSAAVPEFAPSH